MKECIKCGTKLNTVRGIIRVDYPIFVEGRFIVYSFCRCCFYEADKMRSDKIVEWVHETNLMKKEDEEQ